MNFWIPFRICIIIHLHIIWSTSSAFKPERCRQALGMQSGAIPDQALTASSSHDNYTHGPQNSRLNKDTLGGAWCARGSVQPGDLEYLQINLSLPAVITNVATQGRYGRGQGVEYLPSYKIQYWRPGFETWKTFKNLKGEEVLIGNSDTRTVVIRYLEPAIIAQAVRFIPHLEQSWIVCLRVELYGCNCTDHYSRSVCGLTDIVTTDAFDDIGLLQTTSTTSGVNSDEENDVESETSSLEAWPFVLAAVAVLVIVAGIGFYCYKRKKNHASPRDTQVRFHSPKRNSHRESVNEYEAASEKACASSGLDYKIVAPSAPLYQELDPEYNSFLPSSKVPPSVVHVYEPVAYAETDIFLDTNAQNEFNEKAQLQGDEIYDKIARKELKFIRNIGKGKFGEIHLCVLTRNGVTRLVAVKTLSNGASQKSADKYNAEIQSAALYNHPNIVKLLGVCNGSGPQCMVIEYTEMGDLQHFLMKRQSVGSGTYRVKTEDKTIGFQDLSTILKQISSGMKYLESSGHVHGDLATRNCLIGLGLTLKISDLAVSRHEDFPGEYFLVDKNTLLPIRWMPWEALYLGNYSNKSDVWSFGVTVWEVLTLCKQLPYHQLSDQDVINSAQRNKLPQLHQPLCCPEHLYKLVKKCLSTHEAERPTFVQVDRELNKM